MPNLFSLLRGNRFCRDHYMTVMLCLDHVSLLVMYTTSPTRNLKEPRNLKLSTCSTAVPLMRIGACSCSPQSSRLSWSRWGRGCCPGTTRPGLWPPPYRLSHCCRWSGLPLLSAHLMMVLESCLAVQSWVNREYRRVLSTHPWGAPILSISVADVLLSTLTTWGWPGCKFPSIKVPGYYERHLRVSVFLFAYGGIQVIQCCLSVSLSLWWYVNSYKEYRWKLSR